MTKITFVYPDFESLGVEYLMAICRNDGHKVDFVYYQAEDTFLGRIGKTIPFQQIAKKIADTQPHIVAFSCVTDNYQFQLRCAKDLKEIMPNVITIFGGVHPTAVPDKILQNAEVDCVAVGEAEKSFSDFLKEGKSDDTFILPDKPIKGIVYKKEGKLVGKFEEGPLVDLDTLPFPYKTPFFLSLKGSSREYRIMASRGCPYSCSYCFNSFYHKLRGKSIFRQRTVDNVIDELIWAKSLYPLKYILFIDDSFTTNSEWIFEFCKRYKKEIGIPFACVSIPHYITRKKAEVLSSAGCIHVEIGIQSLSEEICSEILHRKSSNTKIAEVISILKDVGIMVQVDHMLGIPGDTLKLHEESAIFYNKYRPNIITTFWLNYYPKTSIVEIAKQRGVLTERDISNIEGGKRLTRESCLTGGSMSNPKPYYSISLLLNYLPILPKFLVSFLVCSRLYRIFRVKNFFISAAIPRFIHSIFNPKDFRGRGHIIRFVDKIFVQKLKRSK